MHDEVWFSEMYQKHRMMLQGIGRVFLGTDSAQVDMIEDYVQEVFTILWNKRGRLRQHPNIEGWLVETMRRSLLSGYGKAKRRAKRHAFSIDASPMGEQIRDEQADALDALIKHEHMEKLSVLLGKENAEVFYQSCVEKRPAKELAAKYGISENAVHVRISRIRKKILAHADLFMMIVLILMTEF